MSTSSLIKQRYRRPSIAEIKEDSKTLDTLNEDSSPEKQSDKATLVTVIDASIQEDLYVLANLWTTGDWKQPLHAFTLSL